jgi:hypothetical protein
MVGEEPDSVLLKKGEEAEPSQDDTDHPVLLAPRILPFPKELWLHLFSISIQEFYVFPRPLFFETSKNEMDKFLFLGTHTRFVTTKRIMVTPSLTTSFMNLIVIEIHVLPRQNL